MAKQGSIKHYRQTGASPAPTALPYGEVAVAKDGSLYVGNEANAPVKTQRAQDAAVRVVGALVVQNSAGENLVAYNGEATKYLALQKAQVGLGAVQNTADKDKKVFSSNFLRTVQASSPQTDTGHVIYGALGTDGIVNFTENGGHVMRIARAYYDASGNPIMPKTGGTFTGTVTTNTLDRAGTAIRNACVVAAGTYPATNQLVFYRK